MKTNMKQFTAGTFIALLLLVGNVNAEGTEAKAKAASREIIETTLQVEKWMTDESIWNTKSTFIYETGPGTETSLELENWMTSAEIWNINSNVEETETELTVENWMISENVWK